MAGKKPKTARQYAAIPFRVSPEGIEILMVTSRETARWVIPKGWPMKGRRPHSCAAKEASQEAGVRGKAGKKAIGSYTYSKRLADGELLECRVDVFPLPVDGLDDEWKESDQRTRRWFTPSDAADSVVEPELKKILVDFGSRPRPSEKRSPR